MDMIKGLERLQVRIAGLISETERVGAYHLVLLKSLYTDLDTLINNPARANPEMLDELSLQLAHRSRAQDDLAGESYDTIAVGLRLLARARRHEIETTCGPDFAGRAESAPPPAAVDYGKAAAGVFEQAGALV